MKNTVIEIRNNLRDSIVNENICKWKASADNFAVYAAQREQETSIMKQKLIHREQTVIVQYIAYKNSRRKDK